MSSFSLNKFGENLPVTGIVALSQIVFGLGVGLLVADKLGRDSRQRTAIALMGAGAATVVPLVAGVIDHFSNRPGSSRDMKRRLAGIRRETSLSQDD